MSDSALALNQTVEESLVQLETAFQEQTDYVSIVQKLQGQLDELVRLMVDVPFWSNTDISLEDLARKTEAFDFYRSVLTSISVCFVHFTCQPPHGFNAETVESLVKDHLISDHLVQGCRAHFSSLCFSTLIRCLQLMDCLFTKHHNNNITLLLSISACLTPWSNVSSVWMYISRWLGYLGLLLFDVLICLLVLFGLIRNSRGTLIGYVTSHHSP